MLFNKRSYIRNKTLLKNVCTLDCQLCGSWRSVQASHANWGGGKGMGIKADDNLIAALCQDCHAGIDHGNKLSKGDRQKAWLIAHKRTVCALIEDGKWPHNVPVPDFNLSKGLI
jgi:hypothetical protein